MSTKTTLLKEKAYQEIYKAILNDTFPPGEFLSERKLIEFLGMSKTPIKSALDRLEAEGFVQVWPKQGIVVKELSIERARDIFELRTVLESYVCRRLSGRLKQDETAALEDNLAQQKRYAEAGDEPAFTQADGEFHLLLSQFSGNNEIHTIMKNYQALMYRTALNVNRRVSNRMHAAYDDHRRIYQALLGGEPDRSAALMKEHLDFGKGILTE